MTLRRPCDVHAEIGRSVGIDDDLQLVTDVAARIEHIDLSNAIQRPNLRHDNFSQPALIFDQPVLVALQLFDEIFDQLVIRVTPFAETYLRTHGVGG